jgi:hypothetical protein
MKKTKHQCCEAWEKAQQSGTDNEAYGRLLYGADDWRMGCDLPPVKFCPWCGAEVTAVRETVGND